MTQAQLMHNAVISGFVDSLQEPHTPYISPKRLSQALGEGGQSGAADRGSPQHSSQSFIGAMREMVKVISAATELTGDVDKAIYWYRNEPIADYGHRTAAELVADGHVEAVLAFIRDLENGARG